jgi:ubiquitin-protein ligase
MSQTRQTSGVTTSTSHYTSSRTSNSPSIKALQLEYAKLQKEPVEGFTVKLDDDANLYKWHGMNDRLVFYGNIFMIELSIHVYF